MWKQKYLSLVSQGTPWGHHSTTEHLTFLVPLCQREKSFCLVEVLVISGLYVCYMAIWGKSIPEERTARARALRLKGVLQIEGEWNWLVCLEQSEQGEECEVRSEWC